MGLDLAHAVLWAGGLYAGIGALVGVPFVISGIGRIDPAAKASPWTFRLLVLPGVIAMWPLLLLRWSAARDAR
jgi:hypothetical protein